MGVTKNLVLGGSGTIGSALCKYLVSQGEQVTNLDVKEGNDLCDMDMTPYAGHDFAWFLAWDVGGAKYLSEAGFQHSMMMNNARICTNVFSFLEKTKMPFLFTSSQLAAPDNTYGVTKLMGERWTHLLNGITVRLWNVYGWEEPGTKSHVIPDLVIQAMTQGKITLMTDGEEERQFIFMNDCVQNFGRIRKSGEKIVHLTNGEWIKIIDIARVVGKLLNVEVIAGNKKGYQNKIEPDPAYKNYPWETSLEKGIQFIMEKAHQYLTVKSAK